MGRIQAGAERSFDPTEVHAAVRDAGFDPREIRVVVVGEVSRSAGGLYLELDLGESRHEVLLQGDRVAEPPTGRGLRIVGLFQVPEAPETPPQILVERWEGLD